MKELLQRAKELEPELLENRRWLHRHPELGFELKETCAFVEEKLKAMGYACLLYTSYSILCYNKKSSRPVFYRPQCGRPQKKRM